MRGVRTDDPNAYLRFLPSPDPNKHGKNGWMLPNLSSLTNMYASTPESSTFACGDWMVCASSTTNSLSSRRSFSAQSRVGAQ